MWSLMKFHATQYSQLAITIDNTNTTCLNNSLTDKYEIHLDYTQNSILTLKLNLLIYCLWSLQYFKMKIYSRQKTVLLHWCYLCLSWRWSTTKCAMHLESTKDDLWYSCEHFVSFLITSPSSHLIYANYNIDSDFHKPWNLHIMLNLDFDMI